MTNQWVVTTATEKVAMDQARTAEVTFTVTNQSTRSARAMFDIRTGDGVDESWFTIEDPQRPIRAAASAPYLVRIQVPQTAPAGSYEFEARVYPPDSAPEENFVLSRRVLVDVPPPPAPEKKPFPWWIVAAAALLVLVIGVVTWIVWPSGDTSDPSASASPSPSASVTESAAPDAPGATVPKLLGLSLANAKTAITKANLTVGVIQYRYGPGSSNTVTRQSLPPAATVAQGSAVAIEISAPAAKPVISVPVNNSSVPPGRMPAITWTQPDTWPTRWLITMQAEHCLKPNPLVAEACLPVNVGTQQVVTSRTVTPPLPQLIFAESGAAVRDTGWITVYVQVLDDYGTAGDPGTVRFYLEH